MAYNPVVEVMSEPQLPVRVTFIRERYYIFDVEHVSYLRRTHNIPGVLLGTLPQACNQNVFLGLPLELMLEEVKLLVETGVACIVDGAKLHYEGVQSLSLEERAKVCRTLTGQGRLIAKRIADRKQEEKEAALKRSGIVLSSAGTTAATPSTYSATNEKEDGSLFLSNASPENSSSVPIETEPIPYIITPTSSDVYPFSEQTEKHLVPAPALPKSRYALYSHLHQRGYFLTPGLRFGCPFMAYPGDPLRFHSHFLVRPVEEDEVVPVMDLVAIGRLGTGVKKGLLIGGLVPSSNSDTSSYGSDEGGNSQMGVRCFTLEWSGM